MNGIHPNLLNNARSFDVDLSKVKDAPLGFSRRLVEPNGYDRKKSQNEQAKRKHEAIATDEDWEGEAD